METTLRCEKVILVKELNEKFHKIGEVFEIANVFEDSFLLRDANTKIAIGLVNFEDFERCFVHEVNFKGWTDWYPLTGFDGQTDAYYRTNRKKVQVRFLTDKVRGESCCHRLDEFNLFFGIQTAYFRASNKALTKKVSVYEEQIKAIEEQIKTIEGQIKAISGEIADNENIIKRMVNSLNK